jgi:hypothetical protein
VTFLIGYRSEGDRINVVLEIKGLNDQIESLETQCHQDNGRIMFLNQELNGMKEDYMMVN